MPLPRQLDVGADEFSIGHKLRILLQIVPEDPITLAAASRFRAAVEKLTGSSIPLKAAANAPAHSAGSLLIVVHHPSAVQVGADESYVLSITAESARLEAETSLGALRGMATLRQLLQKKGQGIVLPVLTIHDSPQFPWRGLMIDTARHFMPIEVLQRNIDAMELAKLNVLYLHLSDNEGFRIESKVFPKLQAEGSNGKFLPRPRCAT